MKLALQLRIMIATLRKHGWRSLLAILCVAIGIASTVLTLALGAGAQQELRTLSDSVGKNLFVVKAATRQSRVGRAQGWFPSQRLRMEDTRAVQDLIDGVSVVVPIAEATISVQMDGRSMVTNVRGVGTKYFSVRNFQIDRGSLFDDGDDADKRRVAVVGPFVAQRINGGNSMLGERISIAGVPFEVVGELRTKGVSGDGTNEDDQILIPLNTALKRVFSRDYLSSMLVQVENEDLLDPVKDKVKILLDEIHGLHAEENAQFDILSMIRTDESKRINSEFLQGISQIFALITLSVGGVGVFSIVHLNVKDRTPEIGLRMAIGATRHDIAALFITEACLLGLAGGILGIAFGWAGIAILSTLTDWPMALTLREVLLPLTISSLIALVCGVVPAVTAARLMPMDALTAE